MIAHRIRFAGLAALIFSLGCQKSTGGVVEVLVVASVEVTPGIGSVVVNQTTQLTAVGKTSSGLPVTGRPVTWSSEDANTAQVNAAGLVSGIRTGGPLKIRATIDGVVGEALITVNALPVSRVTVSPPASPVQVGASIQLTATAFDAGGAVLTGRSFLWTSSATTIVAVTSTGIALGVAPGGPVTITATSEGQSGTAIVTVAARPADRLGFAQEPSSAAAGAVLAPPIKVAIQDNLLATVVTATDAVTIALAGNPGGSTLSGTTTVNAVNGIATFSNLSLNKVGTGYTLLATAIGLTSVTSAPFNVTAGSAGQLFLATQPSGNAQSGLALVQQPVVQLRDAIGNNVLQAGVVVTAALASGGPTSTIGGTITATTNASGVATFTNLSITGPAGPYTLGFSSPGLTGITSGPIILGSGAGAQLGIATAPAGTAQNATPLNPQPAIQVRDVSGNPVATAGVIVTAALASGTGALGGAVTATTNANGLATFASLAINGSVGSYTLSFSAPGLATVFSGPIVLTAGTPTKLFITVQPSATAVNGAPFAQQPSVQLRDASNNPVLAAGVIITATSTTTLVGTVTAATNAGGVATFTNLGLSGLVGSYTVTFSSAPLTPAGSTPIALSAGAANKLGLSTPPGGASSGVALVQQPVVQLQDASGNAVATAGTSITAALLSGPGGGVLSGTLILPTNGLGAAAYTNLVLTGPAGTYVIQFTSPGLTLINAPGITLGAGAAKNMAANSAVTQSATVATAVAAKPSVLVTDASSNPVANFSITFTLTANGGGGGSIVPATPATVLTNASGIATLTNWTLGNVAGTSNNTVTAAGSGLTGSPVTFNASGTPGPASAIVGNSALTQSAVVGTTVGTPPSVRVNDALGNAVSGVLVTFTVTAAGGTGGTVVPAGPATVTTNALGVATATSWTVGNTAGTNNNAVTATAAGVAGSVVFTASGTAGTASIIVANSTTNQAGTAGLAVGAAPSVKVTDASSNPVPGVAVTFTVTAGGGTVVPAGPTTVVTNGSGIATATSWTLGQVAGVSNTVSATAAGVAGSVIFTASAAAGAANKIVANSVTTQSAPVGTAVAAKPSVIVQDQFNNPISGFAVQFAVTSAIGGSVVPAAPASVTTTAAGIATVTSWTLSSTAGTNTVQATAAVPNGSPLVFNATGTAGAATTIAANSATSQSAPGGTPVTAPPSVKVTDGGGNPVSGVSVTFAASAGNGTVGAPTTMVTNAGGIATATSWTLNPVAGTTNTLTASSAGLTGSPVTFTATSTVGPAVAIAAVSATTQSAAVGSAVPAAPSVKVSDAAGNGVSGVSVTFTIASGGGSTGPANPATISTNASGLATLTTWTLGPVAGSNTLNATSAGLPGSPVLFTATGTAGTATTMTAQTPTSQSATVGTTVTTPPSVRVTDAGGNPVVGFNVTFTLTGAGGSIGPSSPATVTTVANGIATLTSWTLGGTAGTNNYTVTASGAGSPVAFTASGVAGPPTIFTSNSALNQSAVVSTPVGAPPSAKVTDAFGNGVAGIAVTFAVATGGGSIVPTAPITTNASGVATLTSWTLGPAAGTNNNTVTASSSVGSPITFTASGTAGTATTITANSVQTQSATVGTTVAAPPSVRVTDAGGNPVVGFNVTFTLTGAGGSISPVSGSTVTTVANGIATLTSWTLGGTAGTNNYTVTASGVGSPVVFTASGTAGSATTITAQSATTQSATVGTTVAAAPSVRVTDAGGNPVVGFNVTFTLTGAGGSISPVSPASVTTVANGIATLTSWTLGGTAGTNNYTVTASGVGAPAVFTASGTAGPATIFTSNSVLNQSGVVNSNVAAPPSAKVTDAFGNGVAGIAVTFAVATGGGSIVPTAPISTNASGVATLTSWTLGTVAGTNNNTVTTSASVGSPITFTASGTAGTPTQVVIQTEPGGLSFAGSALAQQPVIRVLDAFNNPVPGVSVTATIDTGPMGSTLGGTVTVVTAANGDATYTNLSVSMLGMYTLKFTAASLNVVSASFTVL